MITNPNNIKYELEKALSLSKQYPKGPVWIDIPLDIQNSFIEKKKLRNFKHVAKNYKCSNNEINYIHQQIKISKKPIVLIGSGIKSSNTYKEISKFIKKYKIPLVYSTSAPDAYGTTNKLSIGSVGSQGCSRAGNFAMQNSDLLIVLGSRLNSLLTGVDTDKFARESKLIIVDINKNEHEKIKSKDKLIICDLKYLLNKLLNKKILFQNLNGSKMFTGKKCLKN